MQMTLSRNCVDAQRIPQRRRAGAAGRILAALREWHRRSRSRAALAAMDERVLRDIGLTRCEAQHEVDKPFWRE